MFIITPSYKTTQRVKTVNSAQKSTLIFHCTIFRRFLFSAILAPLIFRRHHHNHSYFVNCWTIGSVRSKHYLSEQTQNNIRWVQNIQSIQQGRQFSKEGSYFSNSATFSHRNLFVQRQSRLLNSLGDTSQQTSTQSWDNLTVVQLKEILREKGLKVSGRKAELIERLLEYKENLGSAGAAEKELSDMAPRRSTTRKRNSESTATLKKKEDVVEDTANVEEVKDDSKQNDVKEKVVKKSKRIKVEPQRITERDELSKLWNAEEALATKGSYSKWKRSGRDNHLLCYEKGLSIITLNLILVYIYLS